MDKNAIKKFAVWARTELIARVSLKAVEYGITEGNIEEANVDSVGGKVLTADEKKQRQALIAEINDKGYKQVMEEVAYTWFNRFSALRFMEVNGYLPSHVRVFTDEENNFKPQIIAEAIHLDLDGLDMEKVYELKDAEKTEELYKYLLIVQCNALNKILPGMFQKIADHTELLLPDNLLREGSVIQQMIELIPEDDWKDAVQIIGWLYQYYNSEKKDDVFAALKKNVKITKENIPAATQLFTPDWIVHYMVENSLGRLWLEGHPNVKEQLLPTEKEQSAYAAGNRDPEDTKWHYYLEEAEQEPEVQAQLEEIRMEYAALTPDQLKVIDPCSGSGHILAYMFDVLMQIYRSAGYTDRDAAASIVEHNLYGLDIDDRAAQMAYFVVMMKGCHYDSRFLRRHLNPHVYAIQESGELTADALGRLGKRESTARALLDGFKNAKEYGSILQPKVTLAELDALQEQLREVDGASDMGSLTDQLVAGQIVNVLYPLVEQARMLVQKYDVVVTNPPYMGGSGMNARLSDYVKKVYPDSKSDLFAVFIERCAQMDKRGGYQAMITQHAWMFLSSFEKLRAKLQLIDTVNMAHLGARGFDEIGGEVVQTTSFVMRSSHTKGYKGTYCRLIDGDSEKAKAEMFVSGENRYVAEQDNFSKIPGSPVAYWVSKNFIKCFDAKRVSFYGNALEGIKTGDNDRFLRLWFEPNFTSVSLLPHSPTDSIKWVFTTKGGEFRKWYGNIEYVMYWANNGREIRAFSGSSFYQESNFHWAATTWTYLTSGKISFRLLGDGFFYNNKGPAVFCDSENIAILLTGLLNTNVANYIQRFINPTLTILPGNIRNIPCILPANAKKRISQAVADCVDISRTDWNAYETSWDFKRNPLV